MDLNKMLTNTDEHDQDRHDTRKNSHTSTSRSQTAGYGMNESTKSNGSSTLRHIKTETLPTPRIARGSPAKKDQKHVVFQLIDPEDPRIQARLPMRVMISSHDNTDSIITTVKNFYGLYEYGVSFENKDGISIIAAYDNFDNDMTVYVRTVAQPSSANGDMPHAASPKKPMLGAPFEARTSFHGSVHSPSRNAARSAGLRSMSPSSELGRRSISATSGIKARLNKGKSKENSIHGDMDGYSSDDVANASVTSSRRSKTELVNAEISVDNIVEGGRRKRAFESSELPLFVPPQMPISASISSISPQRRSIPGIAASPHAFSNQQNFSYTLPSPQSHGHALSYGQPPASQGYGSYYQNRTLRGQLSSSSANRVSTSGIMPTPDPTVGSAISDEDVALQLMRLGDASNFSYGRTSTSTVDDTLSGKAEAPSSDDEEDESLVDKKRSRGEKGPQRKKQRVMNEYSSDASSDEECDDSSFQGDHDHVGDGKHKHKSGKPQDGKTNKSRPNSFSKPKSKTLIAKVPMSPASLTAHSRKASVASSTGFLPFGPDEEDLSSKPRCQRCRKSKKGCDRQRPCGRCKDAGIGIEGCVSEDEGNGRKGRYGRHMGVPVKKADEVFGATIDTSAPLPGVPNGGYFLAPAPIDKSKKRKR